MADYKNIKHQRGLSLVEAIAALTVSSILLVGGVSMANDRMDEIKAQTAAKYQQQVDEAATRYIHDNFAAITGTATATNPAKITVAMLQSTGYLSASFSGKNAYGQTACVLALQPTANKLQTLVLTEGGSQIPTKRTPLIAASVGAAGGYIPNPATGNAQGAYGGWTLPLSSYTSTSCSGTPAGPNHLATALFFDNGNLISDYLYRNAVPGHPEANQMATALDMTNNNINNGGTINTAAVNSTNGSISNLSSTNGSISTLNSTNGTISALSSSNGTISSLSTVNGSISTLTNTTLNGSTINAATGNYTGNVAENTLQVNGVATSGTACSTNGLVAQDGTGKLLSCQSGVWGAATGSSGSTATGIKGMYMPLAGQTITCSTGGLYYGVGYAQVDSTGAASIRLMEYENTSPPYLISDSGWVSYTSTNGDLASGHVTLRLTPFGIYATTQYMAGSNTITGNCTKAWS